MFVKIFAVLYELRLKRLEALSEEIHEAYRTTFHEYYRLIDEHAAIREEYSHIPKYLLSEAEKAHIGAAGGRQSEALAAMNEREKTAARIDLAVSRTKARAAYYAAKLSVMPSRELVVTARSVVALQ
jgi:hypothetical protein